KNEEQQLDIDKMMAQLTFMTCKREAKKDKYYTQIRWYRKNGTLYAYSTLYQNNSYPNEICSLSHGDVFLCLKRVYYNRNNKIRFKIRF
ncbi:hypothetical protein DZC34_08160, partial [Clostridium botulinum]